MLFSLEKRKIRWKLIYVHKYLGEGCEEDGVRLFSVMPSDRIRDNRHKLKHSRFSLNTGKHFFTVKVARHMLPRESVESSSLEISKAT